MTLVIIPANAPEHALCESLRLGGSGKVSTAPTDSLGIVTSTTSMVRRQFEWPRVLTALMEGEDLTKEQTFWAMEKITGGQVPDVMLASFLVALRAKGETVDELTGLADAIVSKARPIRISGPALDIVGTGGDRLNTVNISTMAALVCAGAGATVVKHGNRASSSRSGSADVLEVLGVQLDMPVDRIEASVRDVGIAFLFAQHFHPSMRFVASVRAQLQVKTSFNFLGPMINPAKVKASAIGVADRTVAPLIAGVFAARGDRALVFRGRDGLDELTVTAASEIWEVRDGRVDEHEFDPLDFGMPRATIEDLEGHDATYNAQVVNQILAGHSGHIRNVVVLNAAAGIVALNESAQGSLYERMTTAIKAAERSIDSGAARLVLDRWVDYTSSERALGQPTRATCSE